MSLRTREQKDPELSFSRLLAFSIMLIRSVAAAQRDDFLGVVYEEARRVGGGGRCHRILSGMLERCYNRSKRDLARLRMALERRWAIRAAARCCFSCTAATTA